MINRESARKAAFAYAAKENMGEPADEGAVEEATDMVVYLVSFYLSEKVPDAEPLLFGYTNYRGEFGIRRVIPLYPYWGSTEYHPEPQWLLRAFDLDKQADRDFAMKDMSRL